MSVFPVVNALGEKADLGEFTRWLGEAPLFPTALLPSDNLSWVAIDDSSAKAIFAWAGSLFVKLANKITSWSAIPSNDNVPSEKLVKDSLDAKANLTGGNTFTGDQVFDSLHHVPCIGTDSAGGADGSCAL